MACASEVPHSARFFAVLSPAFSGTTMQTGGKNLLMPRCALHNGLSGSLGST